jgi:NAD(P)-dependent dehydrogenase (short-subunit alcohol dehydrogenase family)
VNSGGVAVVTGASRGIGRAVALELARHGFDVIATMRDPDSVEPFDDDAGSVRAERLDVTAVGSFSMPSELRVLVNNAAIELDNLPVEHTSVDDWRTMFETNVFGLVEVTRRAIPSLRAAGGGVICNITSSSLFVPMPFFGLYRASKAAVSALGESLQAELAGDGVRVVEVTPGPIATDMLAASSDTPEAARFDGYRALAELVASARAATVGDVTPVGEAARRIVAAIMDDESPLRVPCDPMGAGLLDSWQRARGDELLRAYLEGFRLDDRTGHSARPRST